MLPQDIWITSCMNQSIMNKEHQELYNATRHVKDVQENEKIHFVSMVKCQNLTIAKASELWFCKVMGGYKMLVCIRMNNGLNDD